VIPQFSEKKLNFFFSFLSCSVALGFGVSGGIPQETVDLLPVFPLGSGAQMGERVWAIDLDPVDGPLIFKWEIQSVILSDVLELIDDRI
jgi:hypothetical protein